MSAGALSTSRLAWTATRAQCRVRHVALAVLLGAGNRLLSLALLAPSQRRRPPRDEIRRVESRFAALIARDLDYAASGRYPSELLADWPIGTSARLVPSGLVDAARVVRRRRAGRWRELPEHAHPERYPAYYRRNFHWQTDGWLSARSARLYDASVELLFAGTADIMRDYLRDALEPALAEAGFRVVSTEPHLVSKVVVGRK